MTHDQIVAMPSAHQLRRVRRALKHAASAEVGLVIPAHTRHLADLPGLDMVLAWARDYERELTLIGGDASMRAEAVTRGLRVATDEAAWLDWLAHMPRSTLPPESGAPVRLTWRVIRPSVADERDALPDFVAALGRTAGMMTSDPLAIPADECYEDAVIATLWDTCDIIGALPHTSNG